MSVACSVLYLISLLEVYIHVYMYRLCHATSAISGLQSLATAPGRGDYKPDIAQVGIT